MNTKGVFSRKEDKWETPQWLFNRLNRIFNFELDVCANDSNHKCDKYFTEAEDGLKQSWGGTNHGVIHLTEGKFQSGFAKHQKQLWTIDHAL